jgi:hypothetical protein
MIKKAETPRLAVGLAMVRRSDRARLTPGGEMTNLAVPAAVIGLATCSSSARSMAAIAPLSGPETPDGRLTGPAAMADNPAFRLMLAVQVATTATIRSGARPPKGASR